VSGVFRFVSGAGLQSAASRGPRAAAGGGEFSGRGWVWRLRGLGAGRGGRDRAGSRESGIGVTE